MCIKTLCLLSSENYRTSSFCQDQLLCLCPGPLLLLPSQDCLSRHFFSLFHIIILFSFLKMFDLILHTHWFFFLVIMSHLTSHFIIASHLYQFLMVDITRCHNLGVCNKYKVILLQSGRSKVQSHFHWAKIKVSIGGSRIPLFVFFSFQSCIACGFLYVIKSSSIASYCNCHPAFFFCVKIPPASLFLSPL